MVHGRVIPTLPCGSAPAASRPSCGGAGFGNGSPLVAVVGNPGGFLVPLTLSENFRMVRDVGFTHVDVFMKIYNFTGILAIKMGSGETKSWDSDDQD